MNGWLIYNGGVNSSKLIDMIKWYKEIALSLDINLELISTTEIYTLVVDDNRCIKYEKQHNEPNFILFLDKDVKLARMLEKTGYSVFNSSETIAICDDKIRTYELLANNNIKMPKTIFSPLIYPNTDYDESNFLNFIEKEIKFPLIIKEALGSFGQQVYLVNNHFELLEKSRELKQKSHLYQEFITSSYGMDIRLNVVGSSVVASMKRVSDSDFRSNVAVGGKIEKVQPSEEFKELAIKVSQLVGADFAGVDLLIGENGEPIVCEVNSNAYVKNISNLTGINVAECMFKYIKQKIDEC